MKNYIKISVILLVVTFLMFSMTACQDSHVDRTITVQTITAKTRELEMSLSLSGVLLPAQTADISSRITERVKRVIPEVGSVVKAGEVLVELDTEWLDAQLMQAQAGLKSAEAAAKLAQGQLDLTKITEDAARKNHKRIKALYDSGTASQSQMDDVTDTLNMARKQRKNAGGPALEQARAAIDTAQANIRNLQVQLNNATIRSPFDGIVINRDAEPGEVVSPGNSVISIANTSTLKMKSSVSQDFLPLLTVGQEIDVKIDIYPERVFKGTISGIGPIAFNTGGIFPVEIAMKNDGSILSGLSAHATLDLSGRQCVVVPTSAVLEIGEKSDVFVIRDSIALKRHVTIGLRNEQGVEILNGLEDGEVVAVTNIRALADNMPVNIY